MPKRQYLTLTPAGEAAVAEQREADAIDAARRRAEYDGHGLADFVALATCECGAEFQSSSGEAGSTALALLYDHMSREASRTDHPAGKGQ